MVAAVTRAGPITAEQAFGIDANAAETRRAAVNEAVYNHQASIPWRGVIMDKCAQDLVAYQSIIAILKPDIIIETGTWFGGSALFFADMCELNGHGQVLSIDVGPQQPLPDHDRLTFLFGDSKDPATVARANDWAGGKTGMVILDSDHSKAHVLAELDAYADFVGLGHYLVVEDTNVNSHPVRPDFGHGPWEAVAEWLPRAVAFAIDAGVEPYVTFAPSGYLRRFQ